MKKLTIITTLILSAACTASSVAAPQAAKPETRKNDNAAFFKCLNELGPKQDKGFDRCQKYL